MAHDPTDDRSYSDWKDRHPATSGGEVARLLKRFAQMALAFGAVCLFALALGAASYSMLAAIFIASVGTVGLIGAIKIQATIDDSLQSPPSNLDNDGPLLTISFGGDEDPNWQRDGESVAAFFTKVVGVTRTNSFDGVERLSVLKKCSVGEQVVLVREPKNPHSPGGNAVLVTRANGAVLGYVMEFRAQQIAPLLDQGFQYQVVIEALSTTPDKTFCNLRVEMVGRDNDLANRVKGMVSKARNRLASVGAGV
jgi:hypothetical protein